MPSVSVLGKRARAQRTPWRRNVRRRIGQNDRPWETKRKAALALRQARMLMRSRELKIVNNNINMTSLISGGAGGTGGIIMPNISQGDGVTERVGLRVNIQWIKLRVLVYMESSTENQGLYDGFTWQLAIWQTLNSNIRDGSDPNNIAGEFWEIGATGIAPQGTLSYKASDARFAQSKTLYNRVFRHLPNASYGNPPQGGPGYQQVVEVFLKPPAKNLTWTVGSSQPTLNAIKLGVIQGTQGTDFNVVVQSQTCYYDT